MVQTTDNRSVGGASRDTTLPVGDLSLAATLAGDPTKPALVLLHGWPQTRALYDGVLEALSVDRFVIALDLPEVGGSRGAPRSAEKTVLADIMLSAAERAGAQRIVMAGLDVGGMIAFAAARDHGARLAGAVVMNTVVPGLDPWSDLLANPQIWHFAFHAIPDLPEALVQGRERQYFDYFTDVLTSHPSRIAEPLRDAFASGYRRPEALRAGFDWYRAMAADAKHNAAPTRIDTPMLYVRGDADRRPIEPYLDGLRAAGVEALDGRIVGDSGELSPIEAPRPFVALLGRFCATCAERREAL